MRIGRESFIRFAVAVALACYDLPTDRAMTSEEAAQLVKWVIDMALGPDASNVQVEPMENYPASSKMPLIISMAGVQQHLFWFYPQQSFEEMCDALSAMLGEIPISCDSISMPMPHARRISVGMSCVRSLSIRSRNGIRSV